MASAAEQLAANLNFSAFSKAKDLQRRIWFTLGMLIIYRIGTYIPLPGIDPDIFAKTFENFQGGLGGVINVFSGGAVKRMAIFALNIMPYISASIIMQLMTTISPRLEQLKKEGETGRKQINQYTRYLTVLIAGVQAFAIASGLMSQPGMVTLNPAFFLVAATVTLTCGTVFLMWLGEQITARGVGNGISLIIFAGIIAQMPIALVNLLQLGRQGTLSAPMILGVLIMVVAVLGFIVFMERAQRRLLVQYPKRQKGNRMFGGETSHLPLKLNTAGVIPPIFASSLLLLPLTAAGFQGQNAPHWLTQITTLIGPGTFLYLAIYAALIVFFCFFYTAIVFNPNDTADNLKKYGGFIPGIRPGKRTAEYLDYVLTRITVVGALYLAVVCLLPAWLRAQNTAIPFNFGGTSLLIVVSVTMDTIAQIQSHLFAHQYEGLISKSRLRGTRR